VPALTRSPERWAFLRTTEPEKPGVPDRLLRQIERAAFRVTLEGRVVRSYERRAFREREFESSGPRMTVGTNAGPRGALHAERAAPRADHLLERRRGEGVTENERVGGSLQRAPRGSRNRGGQS
jgi:hypothetical protein